MLISPSQIICRLQWSNSTIVTWQSATDMARMCKRHYLKSESPPPLLLFPGWHCLWRTRGWTTWLGCWNQTHTQRWPFNCDQNHQSFKQSAWVSLIKIHSVIVSAQVIVDGKPPKKTDISKSSYHPKWHCEIRWHSSYERSFIRFSIQV